MKRRDMLKATSAAVLALPLFLGVGRRLRKASSNASCISRATSVSTIRWCSAKTTS